MKPFIPVLLALLAACAREPAPATRPPASPALPDPADMTQAAVDAERAVLEAIIVPPPGTARGDVEAVFGAPEEVLDPKPGGTADVPAHRWTLQTNGGVLTVVYQRGLVGSADVRHPHIRYLKPSVRETTPETEEERAQVALDSRQSLRDLREIRERWREPLSRAVWNR